MDALALLDDLFLICYVMVDTAKKKRVVMKVAVFSFLSFVENTN